MAVAVKISDVIKMMKELRNDGYKEVSFSICEEDDELPPAIHIDAVDPDGLFDSVDCGDIEGRSVDT